MHPSDGLERSIFDPSHHQQRQVFMSSYPVVYPERMDAIKCKSERARTQRWDMTRIDGKEIEPTLERGSVSPSGGIIDTV